jgi:DNA polymerase-3 subunit beta
MRRRGEVIDYVRQKYGNDCVANIITYGTLGAKMVIRDVSRVHNLPYADADRLAKMIPDELNITLEDSITNTDDRELIAFRSDKKTVTSLLIKGNFPPVKRLFPETVDNYAVMNTAELIESTRRVSLVLEREAALRFTFTIDGVTLEAIGSEQAQASESIDALLTGSDTVVSLKPQFLLDGLSAVHSEYVRISFTKTDNPNKPGPVLITSQSSKDQPGTDDYEYLLQPNLLLR